MLALRLVLLSSIVLAITIPSFAPGVSMADTAFVSVSSDDDMTLRFSFDPERGVYKISLANRGENSETFEDLFWDDPEYELIPGNVWVSIRINDKLVPEPFYYYGLPLTPFSPYYIPDQFPEPEKHAREICASCSVEKTFHVRHFVNYILERVSRIFDASRSWDAQVNEHGLPREQELQTLAQDLDYLSEIRKLEVQFSCRIVILSKDSRLRVDTDWIQLSVEEYAPEYTKPGESDG